MENNVSHVEAINKLKNTNRCNSKTLFTMVLTLIIVLTNFVIIPASIQRSLNNPSYISNLNSIIQEIIIIYVIPITLFIFIIVIYKTVLASIIFLFIELAYINMVIIKFNLLILSPLLIFYNTLYFITFLVILIISKVIKHYLLSEPLLEAIKRLSTSIKSIDANRLSMLAIHYSLTGLTILLLNYMFSVKELNWYVYGIITLAPFTTIASLVTNNVLSIITLSLILASSWYGASALPLFLSSLSLQEYLPKSPPSLIKGVLLGSIRAQLVYDKPSHLYGGNIQEPLVSKQKFVGKKTWFWRKTTGNLHVDLGELPNMHIVIFGSTGMGKTSLAKSIITQSYMLYSYNFIVIDRHNEYIDLVHVLDDKINIVDALNASINPFELSQNVSPRQRAMELADTIKAIFNLGYIQRNILEEIFIKAYELKGILQDDPLTWSKSPPSFHDVLDVIEYLSQDSEYKAYVQRVSPYIKILAHDVFSHTKVSFYELLNTPSIITIASLPSEQIKSLYVETFLHRLLNTMYTTRINNKVLLVIDEAHTIFKRERSKALINKFFMESRKYGIGIIAITQQPLDTSDAVLANTSLKIIFRINEPRNLDYISRTLAGYHDYLKIQAIKLVLSTLTKHIAVVNIDNNLYIIDTRTGLRHTNKFSNSIIDKN